MTYAKKMIVGVVSLIFAIPVVQAKFTLIVKSKGANDQQYIEANYKLDLWEYKRPVKSHQNLQFNQAVKLYAGRKYVLQVKYPTPQIKKRPTSNKMWQFGNTKLFSSDTYTVYIDRDVNFSCPGCPDLVTY